MDDNTDLAVKGEGFYKNNGGFEFIYVGEEKYEASFIKEAVEVLSWIISIKRL